MKVFSFGIIFVLLLNQIIDISAGNHDLTDGPNCCNIEGQKCRQKLDSRCDKNGPCKYFIGKNNEAADGPYYGSWGAAEDATGCTIGNKSRGKCRKMCVMKDEGGGSGWM